MTQNNKIFKKLCLTSTGFVTVALASSLWLVANVGVGQPPETPEPTMAPGTAPTPAFDQAASPNLAPAPGTALQAPASNAELAALRARIAQLQESLRTMPTSVEEQVARQRTLAELTELHSQLQRQESLSGQYSAYRQAREAQAGLASPNAGFGTNNPYQIGAGPISRPSPQELLDASGLNTGNIASRIGSPNVMLTPGEASLLREQKAGLTQQYRQLQQTLRALQPGDEALAENLRQEQETILTQLRDIDARLVNAPADTPAIPPVDPTQNFMPPMANQFSGQGFGTDNIMEKMQKANQAAQLLREAGLIQLAGHVTNEIPRMSTPNFTETNLVPGAWAQSAGLDDEANNPFHMVSPRDIEGINNSIDELKTKIDLLSQSLADVETQLKLLSHQQVSGYIQQSPEPEQPAELLPTPVTPPVDYDEDQYEQPEPSDASVNQALTSAELELGEFKTLPEEDY